MREKIDVWFEIMIGDGSRHEGKHRCVVWNYDTLYSILIYIISYFKETPTTVFSSFPPHPPPPSLPAPSTPFFIKRSIFNLVAVYGRSEKIEVHLYMSWRTPCAYNDYQLAQFFCSFLVKFHFEIGGYNMDKIRMVSLFSMKIGVFVRLHARLKRVCEAKDLTVMKAFFLLLLIFLLVLLFFPPLRSVLCCLAPGVHLHATRNAFASHLTAIARHDS